MGRATWEKGKNGKNGTMVKMRNGAGKRKMVKWDWRSGEIGKMYLPSYGAFRYTQPAFHPFYGHPFTVGPNDCSRNGGIPDISRRPFPRRPLLAPHLLF